MTPLKLLKVEHNILPKIELVQPKFNSKLLPIVEFKKTAMSDPKHLDFADRLGKLMKRPNSPISTVNELKDAIHVTYEMARRYTLGTAKPREEKLKELANIFSVDIGLLDHGIGFDEGTSLQTQNLKNLGSMIPVISWVQAGIWTSTDSVPRDTIFDEWLPPNPKCGKNGYGLIVVGESMLPKFEPGDRIYVNPDFQPDELKTGDLVIVSCEGDTEATFKKLIKETNKTYLSPLNPQWHESIMELKDGARLIGKVVGLYRYI